MRPMLLHDDLVNIAMATRTNWPIASSRNDTTYTAVTAPTIQVCTTRAEKNTQKAMMVYLPTHFPIQGQW